MLSPPPVISDSLARSWRCFVITPVELHHAGLAIAAVRSGGIGILDWEWCRDSEAQTVACQNWQTLVAIAADHPGSLGLRLRAEQSLPTAVLDSLQGVPYWLILSQWQQSTPKADLADYPATEERRLLLEVTAADQLDHLDRWDADGVVARGHESGGWSSSDSAFLLTQKLMTRTPMPVYVQGGVGVHAAAACRAAGAAGVVLDDQLWLMPESPLPPSAQDWLTQVNGQEAILVGERLGWGCRVFSRPGLQPVAALQSLVTQIEIAPLSAAERLQQWQSQAQSQLGWQSPEQTAWPMGQGIGLADALQRQYRTTGRLIQAIHRESLAHLEMAQRKQVLQPDSPLALAHGTRYPVVQGPMTRVSDSAAFAQSVAQAGGLPMLALALKKGAQVRDLLEETQGLLGDRPWGVGILGFVPHQLRLEQLKVVQEIKPRFALIAGGRPDQALQLEAAGIVTYLHVPTAALLQLFLEQGARRFVFEGRECGGHVGPLSSFVLWESVIDRLLTAVPPGAEAEVQVLFAGGIHDGRSAAMVAAMAAPLAERGIKVGVLMGTAYLFTEEAVRCGAIVEAFQQVAVACQETINLETGPGHASRCAVTPFAQEFYETQRQLQRQNHSPEAIKTALEDLTLGRLRIASKGLRRQGNDLASVPVPQQQQDGMYMIGQAATLRSQTITLAELHTEVSTGSRPYLEQASQEPATELPPAVPPAEDIAVVGLATLLPQAQEPALFWQNIVEQVNALTDIPPERWDWRLYFDPDRQARDKIYSHWGGFLADIPFDPLRFGIPPKALPSIEPMQLLTLEVVRRALEDAGYGDGGFDRDNTSVILGAGGGVGDLGQQYALRSGLPLVVEAPSDRTWDRLPEWTEESFPGLLLNVAAGRVTNRFDLGGTNYIVDAACASSLAALSLAVRELQSGRSNLAIAGGIDTVQNPLAYLCFSKTQALSPSGQPRPFDQAADGITISEGLAVVVLKRRADAERDGDRIYAVIKAIEGSSDGKALGMTAPRTQGQQRAMQRTYGRTGVSPATLGLYEAHGTGTVAGDRAELETIATVLSAAQASPNTCVLGSVKSLIGHTKATAGVAGLVKAALALYYRVRPGHGGVTQPLPALVDPDSPVCLLPEAQPWLSSSNHPRRAGVSAFGFGGTNFHGLLEEYPSTVPTPLGGDYWPQELLVWRSRTGETLLADLQHLQRELDAGAAPALRDLAYTCAQRFETATGDASLAIVSADLQELRTALQTAIDQLQGKTTVPLPPFLHLNLETPAAPPQVAFLFPGQGSQYPHMGRVMALYLAELRTALETADRWLAGRFPQPLSHYVLPPGAYSDEALDEQKRQLTDTRIAQPAIGAIEMGLLALAQRLDIRPVAACGHSYGEYAALYAAGMLSAEDFLSLSAERGRVMAEHSSDIRGGMAAVQASASAVELWLANSPEVVIANLNGPLQTVISGPYDQVAAIAEQINASGTLARLLPVAGAFHSDLVAPAQAALAQAIDQATLHPSPLPVYSNATAQPYGQEPDTIRHQLTAHMVSPVRFLDQVEALYADGVRVFLELGPKNVLTTLTQQILADRPSLAVSLDSRGEGLRGLLTGLGQLAVAGVPLQLTQLFRDRPVQSLRLKQLAATTAPPPLSPTAWWLNGGSIRPQSEPVGRTGVLPTLTLEETVAHRSAIPAAPNPGEDHAIAPGSWLSVPSFEHNGHPPAEPGAQDSGFYATAHPHPPRIQIALTSANRSILSPMLSNYNGSPAHNGSQTHQGHYSIVNSEVSSVTYGAATDSRLAAFQSYQSTMQQFLVLQERVMSQFLGGTPAPLSPPAPPGLPQGVLSPQFLTVPPGARGATAASPPTPIDLPLAPPPPSAAPPIAPLPVAAPGPDQLSSPLPSPAPPTLIVEAAVSSTPAPQPETNTAQLLDQASITDMLLGLVSDRTGYPTDMLGLEQDIEAELGIDSIKRVEILGSFQKSLPAVLATALQGQMESLTRIKTLAGIVAKVAELAQEADCLGKSLAASSSLPRFQLQPLSLPRPSEAEIPTAGDFWITEDGLGLAPQLTQILEARGATVVTLPASALASSEALDKVIAGMRQRGPVRGLVHLAPLAVTPPQTSTDWRRQTQASTKALFQLLQTCAEDLQADGQSIVLAASALGGQFARTDSTPQIASHGGHTGLLKTLAHEWPQVCCRALDCDPALPVEVLSQLIAAELGCLKGPVEVGLTAHGRWGFQTVPQPLASDSPTLTPAADWVLLVTGGHRGITAETLKAILVPGMTIVIVGRSPEPTPEPPEIQALLDIGQLRQHLLAQARAQGQSPSPAAIENAVQRVLNERDTRANLSWFRERARVNYHTVDVTDGEAFSRLIDHIYQRYGRLDGVIHGAGRIADKLLLDKAPETFAQVFDTKADSAFALQQSLRFDTLKLLVFFSSVAGRYGSRGQSDYAAANEVVNRLAWQMHWRWPQTRIVAINWGPWDTTGMASEEVKQQFRDRGIIPISLEAGREFFRQELLYGSLEDVEVVAGKGPWAMVDPTFAVSQSTDAALPSGALPFIQQVPTLQPDSTVQLDHTLIPAIDHYLTDHCIDGKPVLPAAAAAEWLAEFVQAAWPDYIVTELRDLQVLRGVIVPPAGLPIRLQARASSHADPLSLEVLAELLEPQHNRPCYRATVRLQPEVSAPPPVPWARLQGQTLEPAVAYRNYLFHGPLFHLTTAIDALTSAGIDAQVTTSHPSSFTSQAAPDSAWLFDPGLIDVVPQLAIVWARMQHNTTPLPSRIGRLARYGNQPWTGPLRLQLRVTAFDPMGLAYDACISDDRGVRFAITAMEGSCSPTLNRLSDSSGN